MLIINYIPHYVNHVVIYVENCKDKKRTNIIHRKHYFLNTDTQAKDFKSWTLGKNIIIKQVYRSASLLTQWEPWCWTALASRSIFASSVFARATCKQCYIYKTKKAEGYFKFGSYAYEELVLASAILTTSKEHCQTIREHRGTREHQVGSRWD